MKENLNETLGRYLVYQQFNIVAWTVISIIFAFMGSMTNIYTLIVLYMDRSFRKPHHVLVACTCVSDGLLTTFFHPIRVTETFKLVANNDLLLGRNLCIGEMISSAVIMSSSLLGQMLIAVNRAIALFAPLFFQTRITCRLTFIVWILFAIVFPTLYYVIGHFTNLIETEQSLWTGLCMISPRRLTSLKDNASVTFVPTLLSLVLYLIIMVRLMISRKNEDRKDLLERTRGSLALFVNMLIYVGCLFPFWIFGAPEGERSVKEFTIGLWLLFLFRASFSVNPVRNCFIQIEVSNPFIQVEVRQSGTLSFRLKSGSQEEIDYCSRVLKIATDC